MARMSDGRIGGSAGTGSAGRGRRRTGQALQATPSSRVALRRRRRLRRSDDPDRLQRGLAEVRVRQALDESRLDHQQPRAAVAQQVADLRPHRRGVDRHRRGAEPAAGEEGLEQLDPVAAASARPGRRAARRRRAAPRPAPRRGAAASRATRPCRRTSSSGRSPMPFGAAPQHRRQRCAPPAAGLDRRRPHSSSVASAEIGGLHPRVAGERGARRRAAPPRRSRARSLRRSFRARRARSAPPAGSRRRRRAAPRTIARISCTISGARPRLGSSSSSRRGDDISARPSASICRSPPESVSARCARRSARRGKRP